MQPENHEGASVYEATIHQDNMLHKSYVAQLLPTFSLEIRVDTSIFYFLLLY
jgi:hypothetical protein